MSGCIHIYDLKVAARIGIYSWEQEIDQTILISIDAELLSRKPRLSLQESVDYAKLSQEIVHKVQEHAYALIETVAEDIVELVLKYEVVNKVKVLVKKPHAVPKSAGVGFSLCRSRTEVVQEV